MSHKTQTSKNIQLTYKLINYLLYAKNIPDLPDNVSFIPFSNVDKQLNKENEKLLKKLSLKAKPVARAEELKSIRNVWNIIPINF